MVRVPERELQLALAIAVQVTAPLPGPLGCVQESQPGALLETPQLQPTPAVTVTVPLLPLAGILTPIAEME